MKTLQFIDPKKISKESKITFIIGNGFDLGLGMKTRYTNVYDGYIKSPSSSKNIAHFKNELEKKRERNYENWSDFEMGMAEYAKTLSSEYELVECVRDFKGYMVDYLKCENEKISTLIENSNNIHELGEELARSLERFYDGLAPNDVNQLEKIIGNSVVNRQYITFNYTTALDRILDLRFKYQHFIEPPPIHIHGELDNDVVLGVDNTEQIKGTLFSLSRKGKRAFVKTIFNEQYDRMRVESVKKNISESNVICVYGFSMGDSDKTWTDLLAQWLIENSEHHLVVYQYDSPKCNSCNYDEIMDIEDEIKELLLKRLKIDNDAILDQIHIPVGRSIFNFEFKEIVPHELKEPVVFDPMKTYESKTFVMNGTS